MNNILTLTEKILDGLNIRKVIFEANSAYNELFNYLQKATETLLSYGIEAQLEEKDGEGFAWGVNVPNSSQNIRIFRVLEVGDDGFLKCDETQKFAVPGIANLNKVNNVKGAISGIDKFMEDMKKEFGKESNKEKDDEEDSIEKDERPFDEKVKELSKPAQIYAKKLYWDGERLKNKINKISTFVADYNGGPKEFRYKPGLISSGTDNNLYVQIDIDGINLESLNNSKAEKFREAAIEELEDHDIVSDFVVDKHNKVKFLALVKELPKFDSKSKLRLWKVFDDIIQFS